MANPEPPLPTRLVETGPGVGPEARAARHLRRVAARAPDTSAAVRSVRVDDIVHRHRRRRVGLAVLGLLGGGFAFAGAGLALRSGDPVVDHAVPAAPPERAPVKLRTPPIESEATPRAETSPPNGATDVGVFTATYVGGPGDDAPVAVAVLDADTILYGGTLGGGDLGTTPRELFGGGAAALVRLSHAGRQVSAVTRIGRSLADVKVDGHGRILILGQPFGLAALDADAREVLWQKDVLGTRFGLGSDGTIAVLNALDGAVQVLSAQGTTTGAFSLASPQETLADIAVHGPSQTIVVTGTRIGMPKQPLVRAYGYDGTPRWQTWGWTDAEAKERSLTAAGIGLRVLVGPDDRLYFLGASNGANSTFGREGRDLGRRLPGLVTFDTYSSPTNVGNQMLLVLARLAPADGTVDSLLFHLTRQPGEGKGGTMLPYGLAVAPDGRVLITGYQTCCMDRQAERTVAGVPVRPAGRDAFVLGLDADLRGRWLWSTWGQGGSSTGVSVALGHGVGVVAALQERAAIERAPLITVEALLPEPPGGATDAYLATWPIPPARR